MEDNGTVNQLKNALNQLLNAYETLKTEGDQLKKENTKLKESVQSLEVMNTGLNTRLTSLADNKNHNSVEMDEMLGRIESILGESLVNTEDTAKEEEVVVEEVIEVKKPKEETPVNSKDIDLGRMQSLLNGFDS